MHEGSEHFMIDILDRANLLAIHAGRVTILPKDVQMILHLLDVSENYKTDKPMTGLGGRLERDRFA